MMKARRWAAARSDGPRSSSIALRTSGWRMRSGRVALEDAGVGELIGRRGDGLVLEAGDRGGVVELALAAEDRDRFGRGPGRRTELADPQQDRAPHGERAGPVDRARVDLVRRAGPRG